TAVRVDFATSGPGESTAVFFAERVPEPPPPAGQFFSFVDDTENERFRHRASLFDREHRRVWVTDVPQAVIKDVLVSADERLFVRGLLRTGQVRGPGEHEERRPALAH